MGPSCATHLFCCLEQACLDVVPNILSGSISYTGRCTHMQVEDLLEMIAYLRVFKLPSFKMWGVLVLGFWWMMLQDYCLARDHFHICDKSAHGPTEKDQVHFPTCM